jgi:hypothetical protein
MAKGITNIKKERFKNVASRRVQKVLDDLESLSKCANKSTYDYTDDDLKKMFSAINNQMALLKASFSSNNKSSKQTFEF